MTLHKHTTQHDSWLAVSQVNYLHMPNGSKFIQHCQSHLSRGDCERPTKTEMDDAEGLAAAMSATSWRPNHPASQNSFTQFQHSAGIRNAGPFLPVFAPLTSLSTGAGLTARAFFGSAV